MQLYRAGIAAVAAVAMTALAACSGGSASGAKGHPSAAGHQGGTLTLLTLDNPGSVDTAINYGTAWAEENIVYDGLMAYQKTTGSAGNKLVPDLATAIPTPTDAAKTYAFHIRQHIRYSNGTTLKPSDVTNTFERMFKVHGPTAGAFYRGIAGAPACLAKPPTCDLSTGIVANDSANTVTFHLLAPDGEFLDKLALAFAFVVPSSAPNTDVGNNAMPGTGPYMFKQYTPNKQIKLVRNPYFKEWSPAAQPKGYPDTIVLAFGLPLEGAITEVENNQADAVVSAESLPADRLNELSTKYASRTHLNSATAIFYMALNVQVAPFNNIKVRQAVNYAADRNALVKIQGGPKLAVPSCQVLPPQFPGYQQYCPYTASPAPGGRGPWKAPDMAKARSLVAASGTKGQTVTIVNPNTPLGKSTGVYFEGLLNKLGYKASLKLLAPEVANTFVKDSRHKVQITTTIWYQDYQAASDFLVPLTGCAGFRPESGANANISEFCDHKSSADMDRALALQVRDPTAANQLWANIDREVTNQAPMVVMFNPKVVTFVSARVGNFKYNSQWGPLWDQTWVQ
ncbi:MAG: peptide ABC transporter substrate-binding protein [Pseudonocardiales bacterium]|nr:MAG: peptide ABC transporter substrate-binding protein [Pseudonocardiales bacterium]